MTGGEDEQFDRPSPRKRTGGARSIIGRLKAIEIGSILEVGAAMVQRDRQASGARLLLGLSDGARWGWANAELVRAPQLAQ